MVESNNTNKNERPTHILELLGAQITPSKVGKFDEVIDHDPDAIVSKTTIVKRKKDKRAILLQTRLGLPRPRIRLQRPSGESAVRRV